MSESVYAEMKAKLVDIINRVNTDFVQDYVPTEVQQDFIQDDTQETVEKIQNMGLKYDPEVVDLFMQNYHNMFAVPDENIPMQREQFHALMQELMNLVVETVKKIS